jgi:hypothetical protein
MRKAATWTDIDAFERKGERRGRADARQWQCVPMGASLWSSREGLG